MESKSKEVKKWVVNLDRMVKVGSFYTKEQKNILQTRYERLGYNVSFDHDGWMCIESYGK
jgi:hypothetical protein